MIALETDSGPILAPFWTPKSDQNRPQEGSEIDPKNVGPIWAPKLGSKIGPKSTQDRPQTQQFWLTFLGSISEPSWDRFWSDLGVQDGPKIGPKSISRAIMKQMQKIVKKLTVFTMKMAPPGDRELIKNR